MEKIMDLTKNQFRLPGLLVIASLLVICFVLPACGKKGPPRPPAGDREFTWSWTRAEYRNDCLSIQAGLEGNLDKIYEVVIELQPTSLEELCVGCPFLPLEKETFTLKEAMFKPEHQISSDDPAKTRQSASINLTYCPSDPAPAYQWRLLGINVHQAIPNALTPVQYITNKPALLAAPEQE